jgi:nicotinamidase-related amidase
MDLDRSVSLNRQIALFDSDCLQPAGVGDFPLPALPAFSVRGRMQPKTDKIDALYAFAQRHDLTVLFTQCCSAPLVDDDNPAGTLVVPMDGADLGWKEKVKRSRHINIRKRSGLEEGSTTNSFICRYFDAFQHNANAGLLLESLDVPVFVLFGHGFDLCVDSAAKGLLAAGYRVHFLTDVSAPSASGYGPYGTEESGRAILDYLVKIGVSTGTSDEFLREMASYAH